MSDYGKTLCRSVAGILVLPPVIIFCIWALATIMVTFMKLRFSSAIDGVLIFSAMISTIGLVILGLAIIFAFILERFEKLLEKL